MKSGISLAVVLLMMAGAVQAATTYNIANGPVTISVNGDYVITGSTTINKFRVGTGVVANIVLRNLTINLSGGEGYALLIQGGSTVHLTLEGNNVLSSGRIGFYPNTGYAGVQVSDTAKLVVTAQSTGSLSATGGENAAGIGQDSFYYERSGTVIISGGTVVATGGGAFSAGIGAGFNGASGPVTINGGTVTATGEAGIGGGSIAGGLITISGGKVIATGNGGAGIGAGGGGTNGPIIISGGVVSATGDAGIGGGKTAGGPINISGGTVTAKASGAGIGGGFGGSSGSILISGGTVVAESTQGAGIGAGGDTNTCGPITISGGKVTATGSYSGPAIGGLGGILRILGGMVTATGGGQTEPAIVAAVLHVAAGLTIQTGASADTAAVKSAYRGEHFVRIGYPVISVTPSRREVGYAGGRTTFTVSKQGSGTMIYAARETLSWMRIVRGTRGTNRGAIVVSCLANPGAGARTGILTIRSAGAVGSPKKVKIVQGGRVNPLLSVTPEIRRVGAAAGRKSFSVSNKGGGTLTYRARKLGGSWLKITGGADGGNRGTIAISYAANASPNARTGTVRIVDSRANGSPRTVKIVQAGKSSSRSLNPAATLSTDFAASEPVATAKSGVDAWTAAPELVDGNEDTVWTGSAGETSWAVTVDLGEVVPLRDLAIIPVGAPRANSGWLGTADLQEWFDLRAITNWPVPCRAVYLDFHDDGTGAPPAIREIRWEDEDSP